MGATYSSGARIAHGGGQHVSRRTTCAAALVTRGVRAANRGSCRHGLSNITGGGSPVGTLCRAPPRAAVCNTSGGRARWNDYRWGTPCYAPRAVSNLSKRGHSTWCASGSIQLVSARTPADPAAGTSRHAWKVRTLGTQRVVRGMGAAVVEILSQIPPPSAGIDPVATLLTHQEFQRRGDEVMRVLETHDDCKVIRSLKDSRAYMDGINFVCQPAFRYRYVDRVARVLTRVMKTSVESRRDGNLSFARGSIRQSMLCLIRSTLDEMVTDNIGMKTLNKSDWKKAQALNIHRMSRCLRVIDAAQDAGVSLCPAGAAALVVLCMRASPTNGWAHSVEAAGIFEMAIRCIQAAGRPSSRNMYNLYPPHAKEYISILKHWRTLALYKYYPNQRPRRKQTNDRHLPPPPDSVLFDLDKLRQYYVSRGPKRLRTRQSMAKSFDRICSRTAYFIERDRKLWSGRNGGNEKDDGVSTVDTTKLFLNRSTHEALSYAVDAFDMMHEETSSLPIRSGSRLFALLLRASLVLSPPPSPPIDDTVDSNSTLVVDPLSKVPHVMKLLKYRHSKDFWNEVYQVVLEQWRMTNMEPSSIQHVQPVCIIDTQSQAGRRDAQNAVKELASENRRNQMNNVFAEQRECQKNGDIDGIMAALWSFVSVYGPNAPKRNVYATTLSSLWQAAQSENISGGQLRQLRQDAAEHAMSVVTDMIQRSSGDVAMDSGMYNMILKIYSSAKRWDLIDATMHDVNASAKDGEENRAMDWLRIRTLLELTVSVFARDQELLADNKSDTSGTSEAPAALVTEWLDLLDTKTMTVRDSCTTRLEREPYFDLLRACTAYLRHHGSLDAGTKGSVASRGAISALRCIAFVAGEISATEAACIRDWVAAEGEYQSATPETLPGIVTMDSNVGTLVPGQKCGEQICTSCGHNAVPTVPSSFYPQFMRQVEDSIGTSETLATLKHLLGLDTSRVAASTNLLATDSKPFHFVVDGANVGFFPTGLVEAGIKYRTHSVTRLLELLINPRTRESFVRAHGPLGDNEKGLRALVVLPTYHAPNEDVLQHWEQMGHRVLETKRHHYDDYLWLYAALGATRPGVHQCYVVSNDKMSDIHHTIASSQGMGDFMSWQTAHQVKFRVHADMNNRSKRNKGPRNEPFIRVHCNWPWEERSVRRRGHVAAVCVGDENGGGGVVEVDGDGDGDGDGRRDNHQLSVPLSVDRYHFPLENGKDWLCVSPKMM